MKPYPKYKDSGIQWIGQIPEEWKVQAMKHLFYLKGRIGWQGLKAEEFIDEGPYLVTGTDFENGKVIWERCYHISKERFNEAPEIHVKEGDLLITKDGTIGKLAYIDVLPGETSLNSHLLIIRPLTPDIINKYSYWLLQSEMFRRYTRLTQSGSIMDSLSQEKIANFKFPLPPLSEQQAIVAYLDDKTSKLDECVRLLELQKADLRDYRTAIISETVTRGLNPNAKLKDSGVDWIGQIPEGWMVDKCGHLFQTIGSGTTPQSGSEIYYTNKGHYWLQTGDLNDNYILETSKYVTDLALNKYSLPIYPIDSIVIAMYGATIGKLGILKIESCTNQACCVLANGKGYNHKFAFYCLHAGKQELINLANGGGQPNISQAIIRNFRLPLPPLSEQQAIVDYLDAKTAKIDEAIKRIDEQITDLRAYRTALISDVVTGKIDVRNN